MIVFNMRERGAYEYDKYVINTLQMHNAVSLSELHELREHEKEKNTLLKLSEDIDKRYENIIKDDGLADRIYRKAIMLKNGGVI